MTGVSRVFINIAGSLTNPRDMKRIRDGYKQNSDFSVGSGVSSCRDIISE